MASEQLVHDFTARFVQGDIPGLVSLFTDDAKYQDVFYGDFNGHDGIRGMFETFFREGKDYVWDVTYVVAGERGLAAEANFGFTSVSNGKQARFPIVSIFETEGDKIAAYREYFDFGKALLQTGVDQAAVGKIIQRRMERGQ